MPLLFSQKNGFEDFEWPHRPEEIEYEGRDEFLSRMGYKCSVWELGTPDDCLPSSKCLEQTTNSALPRFIVSVDDPNRGETIFASTRADAMALRIQLAALLSFEIAYKIDEMHRWARRAFHASHGHDPDRSCSECDPEETERREEERQKVRETKRKKDATARIVVYVSLDKNHIGFFYYANEVLANGFLEKARAKCVQEGRDPGVIQCPLIAQASEEDVQALRERLDRFRKGETTFHDSPDVRTIFNTWASRRGLQEPFPITAWNHIGTALEDAP